MLLKLVVVTFTFATFLPSKNWAQYEGSKCGASSSAGTCKSVLECPSAQQQLMKFRKHNLERCGFSGFVEIVCCPNPGRNDLGDMLPKNPESRGRDKIRKSIKACNDYAANSPLTLSLSYQILGGENASMGDFPHMAVLGYESQTTNELQWECGASLISKRFVLTAAHCIVKSDGILPTQVLMGVVDIEDKRAKIYKIKNTIVHPDYQRRQRINDIALIELEKSVVNTEYIQPACLYDKEDEPIGLMVSGWGHTTVNGKQSRFLQKAVLRAVPVAECNKLYTERLQRSVTNLQLCAGSPDGTKDTCQGDSGGPMQIQIANGNAYSIVGVTSYGIGCGGSTPGIYTRVYGYLDWIEDNVWP